MLYRLNTLNKLGFNALFSCMPENQKHIQGFRYRETSSGYVYERTSALAGYSADDIVPDSVLPINAGMRRCLLDSNGDVAYYTDPDNSMFKLGSSGGKSVTIVDVIVDQGEPSASVVIDSEADADNIGCMLRLSDENGTREWYAIITGTDDHTYIVANPLLIDWGLDGDGEICSVGVIGDAKLGGQDGQFMVEVPAFYYRTRVETDESGVWEYREISERPFAGATYSPKFYQSVTEGVNTDNQGNPVDGWIGTWNTENEVWTGMSYSPLGTEMLSVVGYYPRSYIQIGEARSMCASVGDTFHQYAFFNNLALQHLMIVEIASFQTQAKIGYGIADWISANWVTYNGYRPLRRTGDTVRSGNHTWNMQTLGALANMPVQGGATYMVRTLSFRGIENPWGHIFKWVDGYNLEYADVDSDLGVAYSYVTDDPELFSNKIEAGHVKLPDRMETNKYINNTWVDNSRYWRTPSPQLLPTVITTSSTAYMGDYLYVNSAPPAAGVLRVFAVGGYSYSGSTAGAFCVFVRRDSSNRDSIYGGRLCAKSKM